MLIWFDVNFSYATLKTKLAVLSLDSGMCLFAIFASRPALRIQEEALLAF